MGDCKSMSGLNGIIILLTAYLVVFLEARLNGLRALLGAQIDLLPALMVYAGLTSEVLTLTLLSVCAGLWYDALSANPLGASVLPLFLVGYLVHLNRELVLPDELYAQAVLGFAACAIAPLLTLLVLLSQGQQPLIGWGSVWQWLVMAAGGAAFAPLFFRLFYRLNRALNYQPLPESTFRSDREIKRGRA